MICDDSCDRREKAVSQASAALSRAFLRTGRLPVGAVFQTDPVLGVATQDRSFPVSDPDCSLASANIPGARQFHSTPSALVVDDAARRFLLALPDAGRVVGLDATGSLVLDIAGLDAPQQVVGAPDGAVALREGGGRLLTGAADGSRSMLASGVAALRPTPDPCAGWPWRALAGPRLTTCRRRPRRRGSWRPGRQAALCAGAADRAGHRPASPVHAGRACAADPPARSRHRAGGAGRAQPGGRVLAEGKPIRLLLRAPDGSPGAGLSGSVAFAALAGG